MFKEYKAEIVGDVDSHRLDRKLTNQATATDASTIHQFHMCKAIPLYIPLPIIIHYMRPRVVENRASL